MGNENEHFQTTMANEVDRYEQSWLCRYRSAGRGAAPSCLAEALGILSSEFRAVSFDVYLCVLAPSKCPRIAVNDAPRG